MVPEAMNMVQKITFFDKDEAIRYQVKMRQEGHITKMIRAQGKYEVIVTQDAPEWENPVHAPDLDDVRPDND
jgi:hypothetical protein